jgi:Tfp pilus assembly pilus retraction ATPase PilT
MEMLSIRNATIQTDQAKLVVHRYVDAFNRGDLDGLKALLADDAEIQGVFGQGLFERIGKSYELVAMEWFEIEGDRIKRRWGARDAASQARQLGIA